ncbi:triose-phosphate isomerase [Oscillibacter sp.]|uniref:triose-phosphate isomerase n=1 Tax=Oscillibacter sp. TaxID=1945593 RepID=UPI0026059DB0|nr:triose-phosphate isomerase [Oscillibacter sp.]MDD3347624.1 triose-phosphate isomerase [Oscillibacter sp.]
MRRPILAANWKMNNLTADAKKLCAGLKEELSGLRDRDIVVCPPSILISTVKDALAGTLIGFGAQNMYYKQSGAFTGELSPDMLVDAQCRYVIIGHSERRQLFAETDALVNLKVKAALEVGLTPIMCVGETKDERKAGKEKDIVGGQIRAGLKDVKFESPLGLVIAYEPIWAIGTGETATPQDAQDMHAYIRSVLTEIYGEETAGLMRIQYGGSVKPDNIDELMACEDIDGALVGGASLEAKSFARIVRFSA